MCAHYNLEVFEGWWLQKPCMHSQWLLHFTSNRQINLYFSAELQWHCTLSPLKLYCLVEIPFHPFPLFFYPQRFSFPAGSTFSRYRIRYRRPQDFFTRSISVSSAVTQTTIRFLQFGSSYNFSIRAEVRLSRYCFSTLYGAYSDPVNATTMETGQFFITMPSLCHDN